jgi:hypothetical protein
MDRILPFRRPLYPPFETLHARPMPVRTSRIPTTLRASRMGSIKYLVQFSDQVLPPARKSRTVQRG